MGKFYFLIVLVALTLFPTAEGQSRDDIGELVEMVVRSDTARREIDADIRAIIDEFYADTIISDAEAESVLSYLTNAYSEHGFRESGSWVRPDAGYVYVPYRRPLPEYSEADFRLPVDGIVNSGFGFRPQFGRFHHGIDIALEIGDTVRCALPGVVTRVSSQRGGYGNYIVVAHSGGLETLYGHLLTSIVRPGDKVEAGEGIALGGVTGNATGPHVHFETRSQGIALDPLTLFPRR